VTTRRTFLQATSAFAAACILPKSIFAAEPNIFFFIQTDTQKYWRVANPVKWRLQFRTPVVTIAPGFPIAQSPILAHAAEGPEKLTTSDGDRIIRLVLRRCSLNLIELHLGQVVIHQWGSRQADLRPFFKAHRLARPEIKVVLRDRKKETVTAKAGDEFLYGDRIAADFDLCCFQQKWRRRFEQEPDDRQAASNTSSGLCWDGLEDGRISWAAMKSAWRRSGSGVCLNCDGETFWTNFGLRQVGMFNWSSQFVHTCVQCRRSFRDDLVKDAGRWIRENLDAAVRPDAKMIWGKRVKLETKS